VRNYPNHHGKDSPFDRIFSFGGQLHLETVYRENHHHCLNKGPISAFTIHYYTTSVVGMDPRNTLQGTNISPTYKDTFVKMIFRFPRVGYVIVPWRIFTLIINGWNPRNHPIFHPGKSSETKSPFL